MDPDTLIAIAGQFLDTLGGVAKLVLDIIELLSEPFTTGGFPAAEGLTDLIGF